MKYKAIDGNQKFPSEGAYNYLSKNGHGYFFPTDDILYVPVITADRIGKGLGTKLVEELEALVLRTPELKEIAIPTILNVRLLKIVKKRKYLCRTEYFAEAGENVEVYYKTEEMIKNEENKG